jgi:Site-specific recombinase XerD
MSEKRRDNKNRILKTGESQRKDGRYAYKYIDTFGKPQFVYAWKLVATDRTPMGKRDSQSLRDKVKEIQKDLNDNIDSIGKKITVCQLYQKQINSNANVKRNTELGRQYLMNILENDKLGSRSIDNVKLSDAKNWAIRMKEKGYAYQTINNYKRSLKASFHTAVQDDYIRKNPFDFALSSVLENTTEEKKALSEEQEEKLLMFIKQDKLYYKYYDEFVLLLKTGLRISELCGLTKKDLDFQNRIINIDHQLLKDIKLGYYISVPKTKNGIRQIPMSGEIYQLLQNILKKRKNLAPIVIDGYHDFLFLNRKGYPRAALDYPSVFRGIVRKYNKIHDETLFNITPHTLRHTFCTRLANAGMNPKALQYVMGHANITTTLNLYTHASFTTVQTEMLRLIG